MEQWHRTLQHVRAVHNEEVITFTVSIVLLRKRSQNYNSQRKIQLKMYFPRYKCNFSIT